VLRFASFYHFSYINYKPPIKKFLNNNMEKNRFISEQEAQKLKNSFNCGTNFSGKESSLNKGLPKT